jgi:hypothetical protein
LSILQLDPPLPLFIVGRGTALAHLVIDYGPEHDLVWVVFMDATGECWSVPNTEIRGQWNATMGRTRATTEGVA